MPAGKIAIISGAASGMGAATARLLAREGAKVVITDKLEHEGRHVAESIGGTAHLERLDVTDEASCEAVVDATVVRFGRPHVLVNQIDKLCMRYHSLTKAAIKEGCIWLRPFSRPSRSFP